MKQDLGDLYREIPALSDYKDEFNAEFGRDQSQKITWQDKDLKNLTRYIFNSFF